MKPAEIAQQLWDLLWQEYRDRVTYARIYQKMIEEAGGSITNDHIAFRTLRLTINQNGHSIQLGIPYLAKIVEALGYQQAGEYHFPEQFLYAHHYAHPDQDSYDLPKLFISELIVDDLPEKVADLIRETVQSGDFSLYLDLRESFNILATPHPSPLPQGEREQETSLCVPAPLLPPWEKRSASVGFPDHESRVRGGLGDEGLSQTLVTQLAHLFKRPWQPPKKSAIEHINNVSQYGAWVLLYGYAVNHFTGYVNRQQTAQYSTIDQTIAGLINLGVPMKAAIEGSIETGLCQTATQAAIEPAWVADDIGNLVQIRWPYAYYEIAERHQVKNSAGDMVMFEGFLSAQAKQLFEMTRR